MDIQIFNNPEFGDIRTVVIDGEPWFVGNDCAKALGYQKPDQAIRTNVDKEDSLLEGVSDANNHIQKMKVINESGLYALIFGSKLESAKKFKKWVTSEVLPSIRKVGAYEIPKDPMKLLELHYKAIKQVDNKVNTLEQRFDNFEKNLPLLPNEADEVSGAVKKRVVEVLGGKEANAYKNRAICQKVFQDAYRELKRHFNVPRYKDIKRDQKDQAVEVASKYEPSLFLKNMIEQENTKPNIEK